VSFPVGREVIIIIIMRRRRWLAYSYKLYKLGKRQRKDEEMPVGSRTFRTIPTQVARDLS